MYLKNIKQIPKTLSTPKTKNDFPYFKFSDDYASARPLLNTLTENENEIIHNNKIIQVN